MELRIFIAAAFLGAHNVYLYVYLYVYLSICLSGHLYFSPSFGAGLAMYPFRHKNPLHPQGRPRFGFSDNSHQVDWHSLLLLERVIHFCLP